MLTLRIPKVDVLPLQETENVRVAGFYDSLWGSGVEAVLPSTSSTLQREEGSKNVVFSFFLVCFPFFSVLASLRDIKKKTEVPD